MGQLAAVEMVITYYDRNNQKQTTTLVFDNPQLFIQNGNSLLDINSTTKKLRGGSLVLEYANVKRKR